MQLEHVPAVAWDTLVSCETLISDMSYCPAMFAGKSEVL